MQISSELSSDLLPAGSQAAYGITLGLFVALRRGDEIIGAHSPGYRGRTEPFGVAEQRIAKGMAQLLSLALVNTRLVEELEQANRVRSDFVAAMSHELRTPLNVLIGYGALLLEGAFGALTAEQADTLGRMQRHAEELLELISATLDLGRLEAGRVTLQPELIDAAQLLATIAAEARAGRAKPDVQLLCEAAPDLPPLYADPLKLKVVLKNLIGNAVKFTERGRVTATVALANAPQIGSATNDNGGAPAGRPRQVPVSNQRGQWLQFTISDTGIGIPDEARGAIFEPFSQADGIAPRYGGAGLGLHIVRRLVDLLGGRITFDSAVGRGSTFRVALPLRRPEASEGEV